MDDTLLHAILADRHKVISEFVGKSKNKKSAFDMIVHKIETALYAPTFYLGPIDSRFPSDMHHGGATYRDNVGDTYFAMPFDNFNVLVEAKGEPTLFIYEASPFVGNEIYATMVVEIKGQTKWVPTELVSHEGKISLDVNVEEKAQHIEAAGVAASIAASLLGLVNRVGTVMFSPSRKTKESMQTMSKRKLPFYEYRLVKLSAVRELPSPPRGGHHATPRWHQVRGHWRNCKSGKRVFIRPCEKGDKVKGIVEKDYTT